MQFALIFVLIFLEKNKTYDLRESIFFQLIMKSLCVYVCVQ